MSYAAHDKDFGAFVEARPRREAPARPGILRRIFSALMESRQRDVERRIARFVTQSGRPFTDDLEREISQRLFTSNWSVNARPFNDRRFP
jgi:hypothetical protein